MAGGGKFHGRIEREEPCAEPGCVGVGEFRAPDPNGDAPGPNGPGDWRFLCLDHVRAFNGGYNYFNGMSPDEIEDRQSVYGGWERETRAFATNGDPAPRWSNFADPLDAIGGRFRRKEPETRRDGRVVSDADRRHLKTLGLPLDADRRQLRTRYTELVRRFHPDHTGGDRAHEKALQTVIEAYAKLKARPAFA